MHLNTNHKKKICRERQDKTKKHRVLRGNPKTGKTTENRSSLYEYWENNTNITTAAHGTSRHTAMARIQASLALTLTLSTTQQLSHMNSSGQALWHIFY